ncbi:MAG: DegT/DnrJ/EryC1/StrS aminotransferase family protein [Chloroflexi bacterium]|nr:DegT/DnrJ/EryC1/StrS aminotransferase family protein [Chloroflexota bacterium]MDA8189563.1 DegT/DnrJ/EryC1/StrS aminotransferase family protein [Dehalococcoidales bacterium]
MIQLFKPSIGDEEIEAVVEVLRSGWLGLGPKTADFEAEFAKFVGVRHAVALNSCTAALHLALEAAGIGEGDEVIVPPMTFVSTAHTVVYTGGMPVFADVYRDTVNIDPADILRKITSRTKAIIPVHYGGHPCEMDEIRDIAASKGILVIEDAAHACGAEYKGRKIGSLSPLQCFSFHAVKNLATGDGGMITTDDEAMAARFNKQRWMGITKDTWSRTLKGQIYAWRYSVDSLGFKCHMNDISAAIGLVQLKRLSELNGKRRKLVDRYNAELGNLGWLECPVERDYVKSSWHIYAIKVKKRDELIAHLKANDIAPGVHYYPVHLFPYYRFNDVSLPVAEALWQELLSLPLYPDMTEDEQDLVITKIKEFGQRWHL